MQLSLQANIEDGESKQCDSTNEGTRPLIEKPTTKGITLPTKTDQTPTADRLRSRAAHLSELASQIESALVMSLQNEPARPSTQARSRLCERMLSANLHQLHVAAEDLRATALAFRKQAGAIDHNNEREAA
jgi:hypothetical protein